MKRVLAVVLSGLLLAAAAVPAQQVVRRPITSASELACTAESSCKEWVAADNADWSGFADNTTVGDSTHRWSKPFIALNYWEDDGNSSHRPKYRTSGPNGRPYLEFDTDDTLNHLNGASSFLGGGTGFTQFIVVRPQSNGGGACTEGGAGVYSTGGYVATTLFSTGGLNKFCFETYNGGYRTVNSTTTYSLNTWYIVETWWDGSSQNHIRVNGDTEQTVAAATGPGTLANGNTTKFGSIAVDIAERMSFNTDIGATKRANYRQSLGTKYGITVTVP